MENLFIDNWRERVGDKMKISLNIVKNIAVEKSGKFLLVKNNIKHQLD